MAETKTREQWLELANSTDPTKRKLLTEALRAEGFQATTYMSWPAEQRVDALMEKLGAKGGGAEKPAAAASGKKDKVTAADGGQSLGGGLTADDRALLKAAAEGAAAVKEHTKLLTKIHNLLVVVVASDASVKANAEEMGVEVELLGNG